MENRRIFEESTMRSKLFQEHHARDCQEFEESRKFCCEQAERVRQLEIDELSMQKKEDPSTVNQFLSQFRNYRKR